VPVTYDEGSVAVTLRLDAEVGISDAPELKRVLLHALASGKELCVNVESATQLDVTVFQLLRAAARQAQAARVKIYREGHVADNVSAAFDGAGLGNFPVDLQLSN
jgi:anti-anti-sigma regulatory factor